MEDQEPPVTHYMRAERRALVRSWREDLTVADREAYQARATEDQRRYEGELNMALGQNKDSMMATLVLTGRKQGQGSAAA